MDRFRAGSRFRKGGRHFPVAGRSETDRDHGDQVDHREVTVGLHRPHAKESVGRGWTDEGETEQDQGSKGENGPKAAPVDLVILLGGSETETETVAFSIGSWGRSMQRGDQVLTIRCHNLVTGGLPPRDEVGMLVRGTPHAIGASSHGAAVRQGRVRSLNSTTSDKRHLGGHHGHKLYIGIQRQVCHVEDGVGYMP